MIKTVIFDVDGVLIESAEIKTLAFRRLFEKHCPEKVDEAVLYHEKNMGVSRFVKFRYVFNNLMGKELSQKDETNLGKEYSMIVLSEVLKAPLVAGAMEFLEENKNKYLFFVVSGTPEEELKYILKKRGLDRYFKGIYGSPKEKIDAVGEILLRCKLEPKDVVFVGDADTDKRAAEGAKVWFIARVRKGDDQLSLCKYKINDLVSLGEEILFLEEKGGAL